MLPSPSTKSLFLSLSLAVLQSLAFPQSTASKTLSHSHSENLQRLSSPPLVASTHQSSDAETFPVCDFDLAFDAKENIDDCSDCIRAINWYNLVGKEHATLSCPPECCANVAGIATKHYQACRNGCCYRFVSPQVPEGATADQFALAKQLQILAVNEATFESRTPIGQCVVSEGPSEDPKCGPRCATQIQDRSLCAGRNTAEVPRFGEDIKTSPCLPGGKPQESSIGSGSTETPTTTASTTEQPTTEQPVPQSSERACFPAEAHVTLQNGGKKALNALRVGEVVLSDKGVYTPIIGFSHANPTARTMMLSISLSSGHVLTISQSHYVITRDGLTLGRRVRTGDEMKLGNGVWRFVVGVEEVERMGLYNPQTANGGIVVDGVVVSCYTEAIAPVMAHALLAPVRVGGMTRGMGFVEKAAEIWRGCAEAW